MTYRYRPKTGAELMEPILNGLRQCKVCRKWLPKSEFDPCTGAPERLRHWCRDCYAKTKRKSQAAPKAPTHWDNLRKELGR